MNNSVSRLELAHRRSVGLDPREKLFITAPSSRSFCSTFCCTSRCTSAGRSNARRVRTIIDRNRLPVHGLPSHDFFNSTIFSFTTSSIRVTLDVQEVQELRHELQLARSLATAFDTARYVVRLRAALRSGPQHRLLSRPWRERRQRVFLLLLLLVFRRTPPTRVVADALGRLARHPFMERQRRGVVELVPPRGRYARGCAPRQLVLVRPELFCKAQRETFTI